MTTYKALATDTLPTWVTLNGKPVVTVSPTGLSTGASQTNNGADYGPDTPNTKTSGIQEAITAIFNLGGGVVQLLYGTFNLDGTFANSQFLAGKQAIVVPANPTTSALITIIIQGSGSALDSYQMGYPKTTPSGTTGSLILLPSGMTNGAIANSAIFGTTIPAGNPANFLNNVNIVIEDVTFRGSDGGQTYQATAVQLDNFMGWSLTHVVADVVVTSTVSQPLAGIGISANTGATGANNGNGLAVLKECYVFGYNIGLYMNQQHMRLNAFVQYCAYGLSIPGNVSSYPAVLDLDIEQCTYGINFAPATTVWLEGIVTFQSQTGVGWFNATSYITTSGVSNANVKGNLKFYITGGTAPLYDAGSATPNLFLYQLLGPGSVGLLTAGLTSPNYLYSNPANPTSTTSTTAVMMGLGSTLKLTPQRTGRIRIKIDGGVGTLTGLVTVAYQGMYGTGTAPVNGAASTGTAMGTAHYTVGPGPGSPGTASLFAVITGLTVGTAYWFDIALSTSNAADAAFLNTLEALIEEF